MFSVVIPLYNKAEYIGNCINAILKQTYSNFEIVIVNDGSTDSSANIVESISDKRIRLINQLNAGVSAARNRGVEEAAYDIVAFCDADDIWEPNHLEILAELAIRYPECGVYATSYYTRKNNHAPTLPHVYGQFPFDGNCGILSNYYKIASGTEFPIQMSSLSVRKKYMKEIGGFPVGIRRAEDIITIARLFAVCDFAYSRIPTTTYVLIYGGKESRPFLKDNPLDIEFDNLLTTASGRKGTRLFVSSWYKRRMVAAIYAKDFRTASKMFAKSIFTFPWQTKIYTSLIATLFSIASGIDLYSINKKLKR